MGGFGVKLVATTYTWKNGHSRERTLMHTFSAETARKLHGEIVAAGGHLHGADPETVYRQWRKWLEEQMGRGL